MRVLFNFNGEIILSENAERRKTERVRITKASLRLLPNLNINFVLRLADLVLVSSTAPGILNKKIISFEQATRGLFRIV